MGHNLMKIFHKSTHSACNHASNMPFWIRLATVKHTPPSDQNGVFKETSHYCISYKFWSSQAGSLFLLPQSISLTCTKSGFTCWEIYVSWKDHYGLFMPEIDSSTALPQDNMNSILTLHIYNYNYTPSFFEWVTLRCYHYKMPMPP